MRVISFDVGIKNMAYCLFDVSSTGLFENNGDKPLRRDGIISVLDWNIMNLMPANETIRPLCHCALTKKTKKKNQGIENPTTLCNKPAKYKKGEQFFCLKHAQASSFLLLKSGSQTQYKKLSKEELIALCHQHLLFTNEENKPTNLLNKTELLKCLQSFFAKKSLEPVKPTKDKTAGETDLITIGRNMTRLLDQLEHKDTITHVIIENQISPLANRMKTIQGMLCQYFIMHGGHPEIEFISSANKLKGFTPGVSGSQEDKYKQHKKDGIFVCSQFLEKNESLTSWKHCMETAKKDDYADGFLQGIWYLKHKKILDYKDYVISLNDRGITESDGTIRINSEEDECLRKSLL